MYISKGTALDGLHVREVPWLCPAMSIRPANKQRRCCNMGIKDLSDMIDKRYKQIVKVPLTLNDTIGVDVSIYVHPTI